MKISNDVLIMINEDDVDEHGTLVIPEGIKEIKKGSIRYKRDIKIDRIQLPTSLKEIDYEELDNSLDIVHLYIPDGINRLKIRPYTQQATKGIIGKTPYINFGQYVHPWEYLRLPKGFETTNPTTGEKELLDSPTLIVDIKNLDRILANNEYNGETVILNIRNASELSVEKLNLLTGKVKIKSIQIIDIKNQSLCQETCLPYDVETYKKCRTKIDEIVGSIDFDKYKNMPDREKFIFGEMIRKISYITYDKATYRQGVKSSKYLTCRNLIGGLLEETCVCLGYSEIIRNILACCGIESKIIAGDGHCWNQVKLDGKWYNIDFTFDQPRIFRGKSPKFMLKSDKDFKGHSKMILDYIRNNTDRKSSIISQIYKDNQLEKCDDTVPFDRLMLYIYGEGKIHNDIVDDDNDGEYYKPVPGISSIDVVKKFIKKNKIGFKQVLEVFDQLNGKISDLGKRDR